MLVLSACGGGDAPDGSSREGAAESGSGAASGQALKFAQCMRANGVPEFQDPKPDEQGSREMGGGADVDSPAFQRAMRKCEPLESTGGTAAGGGGAGSQEKVLRLAQCMRRNGVPGFPDPQVDASGSVSMSAGEGVDTDSLAFKKAQAKCMGAPAGP